MSDIKGSSVFVSGKYYWSPSTPSEKLPHDLLYNTQQKQVNVQFYGETRYFFSRKTSFTNVLLVLGLEEACLDSLAYESLVPMSQLQTYARLIEQYRSVVLYGCAGMGKTRLCRQLAHFVQASEAQLGHATELSFVSLHDKFTRTNLNSLLHRTGTLTFPSITLLSLNNRHLPQGCLIPSSYSTPKSFTPIVILDNLQHVNMADAFHDVIPIMEKRGPQSVTLLSIGQ